MKISKKIEFKRFFVSRVLLIPFLTFTITLCGGKNDDNGVSPPTTPVCTGGEILNADQSACELCTEGEFPNADRTACVSTCPGNQIKPNNAETCELCTEGEFPNADRTACVSSCLGNQIKPDNADTCESCQAGRFPDIDRAACVSSCPGNQIKPNNADTCVIRMVCTGRQVLNPTNNSCIDLVCTGEGEVPDTTVSPPECITLTNCRSGANKFVSTDENTCITSSACTSTDGQIATAAGNCQVCSAGMVRNSDRTMCVTCDIASLAPGQANVSGTCTACTDLIGDDDFPKVTSLDKD